MGFFKGQFYHFKYSVHYNKTWSFSNQPGCLLQAHIKKSKFSLINDMRLTNFQLCAMINTTKTYISNASKVIANYL